jgi:hypothetical protein
MEEEPGEIQPSPYPAWVSRWVLLAQSEMMGTVAGQQMTWSMSELILAISNLSQKPLQWLSWL